MKTHFLNGIWTICPFFQGQHVHAPTWLYSQMHRFQTLYLKQFSLLLRDKNFDTPKGTSGFPMQKHFVWGKIIYDTHRKDD